LGGSAAGLGQSIALIPETLRTVNTASVGGSTATTAVLRDRSGTSVTSALATFVLNAVADAGAGWAPAPWQ
jgi:hypothetical protein